MLKQIRHITASNIDNAFITAMMLVGVHMVALDTSIGSYIPALSTLPYGAIWQKLRIRPHLE